MTQTSDMSAGRGPVCPTASAAVRHRPLGGSAAWLADGLLADWQRRSRDVSLPLAVTQMEAAGNLGNLRLAIAAARASTAGRSGTAGGTGHGGREGTGYHGPAFMDSDVYKTLEAIAWELGSTSTDAAGGPSPGNPASPGDPARPGDAARPGNAASRGDAASAGNPASPGSGASPAGAGDLTGFFAGVTSLLEQAQRPDGYLNSWIQVSGRPRYAQLESSHELYCAGHLIQAAVAAHRSAAGVGGAADGLLGVARRFADHLVESFLGKSGNDGHPIVESALAELYRETGHAPYLKLASQFIEERGRGLIGDSGFGSRYLQDHLPVRESRAETGHAVRALYLEAGIADVAAETGDAGLLATSVARWDDMVATKTAITGGNGSRHSGEAFGDAYELPPDRAYNETCAAIASFQWSWRLLLATGEAKYADLMERILYNGFGAAVSADGRRFFYVNPLQRRADHYEDDDPGRRREWFSCACCPPNIMRLLASLRHYLATVAGDTLYLHQFTGSRLSAGLPAGPMSVRVATGYPVDGEVAIEVLDAPSGSCGLAVRVPAWSMETRLILNGAPVAGQLDGRGYLVVSRAWRPGDILTLGLDVTPRLSYPGRRVDALRGTVAVERGPLVYCFEQADQAEGLDIEDLAVTPGGLGEREVALPGQPAAVAVTVPAEQVSRVAGGGLPYGPEPGASATTERHVTAVAIPYFLWDNRDRAAMRVWLPAGSSGEAAAGGS